MTDTDTDYQHYKFPKGSYTYLDAESGAIPIEANDLAKALQDSLAKAVQGNKWALYLDLSEVDFMSSRYAKWLVKKIAKENAFSEEAYGNVRIILANASELVLEEIVDSLNLSKLVTFGSKNIPGEPQILGELEEIFRASFEAIREAGPVNASELSDILSIPRPTAANYLEKLVKFGLVSKMRYRGRKGPAYRYHFKAAPAAVKASERLR